MVNSGVGGGGGGLRPDGEIKLAADEHVFGMDSHPARPLVAIGLLGGAVQLHSYHIGLPSSAVEMDQQSAASGGGGAVGGTSLVWSATQHTEACRAVGFTQDGAHLLACSLDRSVALLDVEHGGQVFWRQEAAHAAGINACHLLPGAELKGLIATGDDEGAVKLWDVRQQVRRPRNLLCSFCSGARTICVEFSRALLVLQSAHML